MTMKRVRITPTIANEYMDRMLDEIPERLMSPGEYDLTDDEAREVRNDAKFMADTKNGPEEMRTALRSAYRALAKQLS
jgi:hypothetical protein